MDQTVERGEVYPLRAIVKAIADMPKQTFHEKHCKVLGDCSKCLLGACPIADQG
jgi:hypothetical protein